MKIWFPYHLFTDDIQLNFSFKDNKMYSLCKFIICLEAIRDMLTENFF